MKHQLQLFLFVTAVIGVSTCTTTEDIALQQPTLPTVKKAQSFTYSYMDWTLVGDTEWTIENGIIIGQGGQGYAVSDKQYDNFVLEAEFYPDDVINSGIFVRCPNKTGSATECYEINIWDDHVNQDFRTGAVVTHGKPLAHINTVGKWNTYKIKAMGNHIEVWLNGTKTADVVDDKTSTGHIAFQVFKEGTIRFANVRVTEL